MVIIIHPSSTNCRLILLILPLTFDYCSLIVSSNCRTLVGAATAPICWFSLLSLPFTMRQMVPMCCLASCHAMMRAATWTDLANTQWIYTRITHRYPHWSVYWANITSSPSLLSPTTPIHTTRLEDFVILLYFLGNNR